MSLALLVMAFAAVPDEALVIGPPLTGEPARATVGARWSEHVSARLDAPELALGSTLSLGLDWTPSDCWQVALDTRMRHRLDLDAAGASADFDGRFDAEVRRALLTWHAADATQLTLGSEVERSGRTLARPFDLTSPLDWREGPLAPEGDDRVPTFATTLRQTLGHGVLALRWAPFYFAPRLGLRIEPAPVQDIVSSSELGVRLTQRLGALDLALGYMLRFDHTRALPFAEVLAPTRQHAAGLELALATGPLRWAAEAALLAHVRLYQRSGVTDDRAVIRWAANVSATPITPIDLSLELEGAHAPASDAPTYHEGPDDLWLRARATLMLAWDGVLALRAEARVGLLRDDWWLTSALTVRATDALTLALGAHLFGGAASDLGLGGLFAEADQIWLHVGYEL